MNLDFESRIGPPVQQDHDNVCGPRIAQNRAYTQGVSGMVIPAGTDKMYAFSWAVPPPFLIPLDQAFRDRQRPSLSYPTAIVGPSDAEAMTSEVMDGAGRGRSARNRGICTQSLKAPADSVPTFQRSEGQHRGILRGVGGGPLGTL